jgi:hypothetical protein
MLQYGRDVFEALFLGCPSPEQAIASTLGRFHQMPIPAERLADGGNVNVERGFSDRRARPYPLHEVILRDESAGGSNQDFDDFEGSAAKGNRTSGRTEFPPTEIDLPPLACVDEIGPCVRHPKPFGSITHAEVSLRIGRRSTAKREIRAAYLQFSYQGLSHVDNSDFRIL